MFPRTLALFALCLLAGCATLGADQEEAPLVRHVVLYAYKPDVSEETQAEIAARSKALVDEIKFIRSLEWGADINEGARAEGYTHCLIMTFDSMADVRDYAAHPAHQQFLALARPYLEKLAVVDFTPAE